MSQSDTPLCSVLLPTRGRPHQMGICLDHLLSNWNGDKRGLEIIVRVNEDRWYTDAKAAYDYFHPNVRFTLLVDQLKGYEHLHTYFNQLASLATGKWLFMLCDDGFVKTEGWDEKLASLPIDPEKEIALLQPECNGEPNCFPIVSRAWYRELGHLAQHVSIDGYVEQIGEGLGCMYPLPVYIHHEKWELTGIQKDETRRERDAFLSEWNKEADKNHITAPQFQEMIAADVATLRAYMDANR